MFSQGYEWVQLLIFSFYISSVGAKGWLGSLYSFNTAADNITGAILVLPGQNSKSSLQNINKLHNIYNRVNWIRVTILCSLGKYTVRISDGACLSWRVSRKFPQSLQTNTATVPLFNPLNAELNPICYLLAFLGAHHFLHVSRIRVKSLTLRLLMSYIYIWSTYSWGF